ncbi:MAG: thiamine phosphate synthase [Gemmatimonadetes bacterium]|nr:thiamine phosphate synthase [Gemmatimonadota bacterium]
MKRLRLIVITDARLAAPRALRDVVQRALQGGARVIQLRDKQASARVLHAQAVELLPLVHGSGALLIVNDRADVALAAGADGVHLGPEDLPVAAARRLAPPHFIIGASTDDPGRARMLEAEGASYIGCGAVFRTTTKNVGSEAIGPEGVQRVASAVAIPVVAIGGITPENAGQLGRSGAAGIAVVAAVMRSPDPAAVVRQLLRSYTPD